MLLVEDDPTSRRALELLIAHHGWEVDVATTIAQALPKLASNPAAVVLDLMLPDGDGLTVLRHVRSHGLPIRVIITTGAGDQAYLEMARSLLPVALLRKPIRLQELLSALRAPS